MEKNQIKLGMIVRVDGGPCGRVVEIDNERSSYPYKVRYSGGLAEWASANQMEEILDAPEESVRAGCTNAAKPRRPFKRGDRVQFVPRGWVSYDDEPTPYQEYAVYDDEDLIDTVLKKGFFFAIPYNGGYTTGDEILLIPNDVLSRTAKFFR